MKNGIIIFLLFIFIAGNLSFSQEKNDDSNQKMIKLLEQVKPFYDAMGIPIDEVKKVIENHGGKVLPFSFQDKITQKTPKISISGSKWDITGKFPPDFLWGVAIAAHQVEGYNLNNDWWQFETYADGPDEATNNRFPKFVRNSGRATDHYSLYMEHDLELAKSLGLNTFRMSIEWSRIEPSRGQFSKSATKYYREYLQKVRKLGMKPMVTLWHFTLPQWVQKPGFYYDEAGKRHDEMEKSLGGFQNKETVEAFTKFAAYCAENFGDLVDFWVTHNEPVTTIMMGYMAPFFLQVIFLIGMELKMLY